MLFVMLHRTCWGQWSTWSEWSSGSHRSFRNQRSPGTLRAAWSDRPNRTGRHRSTGTARANGKSWKSRSGRATWTNWTFWLRWIHRTYWTIRFVQLVCILNPEHIPCTYAICVINGNVYPVSLYGINYPDSYVIRRIGN